MKYFKELSHGGLNKIITKCQSVAETDDYRIKEQSALYGMDTEFNHLKHSSYYMNHLL
jgi:hypothetical protein